MNNEINVVRGTAIRSVNENRVEKHFTQGSRSTSSEAATEKVDLSDTAKRLQEMEKLLAHEAAVDTVKVAHVKQALANGAYIVDPNKITDKLLALDHVLAE
ncbi:MAG: flagellar biosynthesis anti-sigma factor FlgM [Gammaproteobacteria bacterium]